MHMPSTTIIGAPFQASAGMGMKKRGRNSSISVDMVCTDPAPPTAITTNNRATENSGGSNGLLPRWRILRANVRISDGIKLAAAFSMPSD